MIFEYTEEEWWPVIQEFGPFDWSRKYALHLSEEDYKRLKELIHIRNVAQEEIESIQDKYDSIN